MPRSPNVTLPSMVWLANVKNIPERIHSNGNDNGFSYGQESIVSTLRVSPAKLFAEPHSAEYSPRSPPSIFPVGTGLHLSESELLVWTDEQRILVLPVFPDEARSLRCLFRSRRNTCGISSPATLGGYPSLPQCLANLCAILSRLSYVSSWDDLEVGVLFPWARRSSRGSSLHNDVFLRSAALVRPSILQEGQAEQEVAPMDCNI